MNRTKTIVSALLVMILPLANPALASDRDRHDRGRGHEHGEYRHGHQRYHGHHGHHGHHRHHYPHHYYHHDGHHSYYHGGYRYSDHYRWQDKQATVTLPFPPLPPFPVVIFKPHH